MGVASVQAARPGTVTPEEIYSQPAALDYHDHGTSHGDHEEKPGGSWADHPYHSDPEKPTAEEEQAQYMREHAHLYSNVDTHAESVPVEERDQGNAASPPPDSNPETTPPAEPAPATSADEGWVSDAPSGWAPAPEAGWEAEVKPDAAIPDNSSEAPKPDAADSKGSGEAVEKPQSGEGNSPKGSDPDGDSKPA